MRFGGDHPTDRRRHRLAVALCREAGILDAPGVALEPAPGPLPDEVLSRVFAPAFIRAVHRYSETPILAAEPEAAQWGIGGDNNAYDGMHHDSTRACAACDAGARAVGGGARTLRARARRRGAPRRRGQPGLGVRHLQRDRRRDPGPPRLRARADRLHRPRRAPRQRDPVDLLRRSRRADRLRARERTTPLPPGRGSPPRPAAPQPPARRPTSRCPPSPGTMPIARRWTRCMLPVVRPFAPDAVASVVNHHHADP